MFTCAVKPATLKPMTHLKVFLRKSLSKATFERKLSYVAYTLAQVFTCESYLSEIERVLFLKVFFRIRWAVIGQSESHDVIDRRFIVVILCIITERRILHWKSQKNIIVVVVVKLNLHSKYSSTHETPLLTCNFCVSTFKCVMVHLRKSLAQVFLRKLLAQATFARNFLMCHRLIADFPWRHMQTRNRNQPKPEIVITRRRKDIST